jgi:hypothetical protein
MLYQRIGRKATIDGPDVAMGEMEGEIEWMI